MTWPMYATVFISVNWTGHFLWGTRNTWPCLTGHLVYHTYTSIPPSTSNIGWLRNILIDDPFIYWIYSQLNRSIIDGCIDSTSHMVWSIYRWIDQFSGRMIDSRLDWSNYGQNDRFTDMIHQFTDRIIDLLIDWIDLRIDWIDLLISFGNIPDFTFFLLPVQAFLILFL